MLIFGELLLLGRELHPLTYIALLFGLIPACAATVLHQRSFRCPHCGESYFAPTPEAANGLNGFVEEWCASCGIEIGTSKSGARAAARASRPTTLS